MTSRSASGGDAPAAPSTAALWGPLCAGSIQASLEFKWENLLLPFHLSDGYFATDSIVNHLQRPQSTVTAAASAAAGAVAENCLLSIVVLQGGLL